MKKRQKGYALLVVLLLGALVLISLSAVVPRILTQGQREKEVELIFRGQQYQRAIGLFHRKFGRFPLKVEELLETNNLSFLRKEFPDPMTADGKWRLIRVGPSGELIGSVNDRAAFTLQPSGAQGQPATEEATEQPGTSTSTSTTMGTSQPEGYPIAGVASRSTGRSIRIYESYNHYNEWEFIYDPVRAAVGGQPGTPATPPPGQGSGSDSNTSTEQPRLNPQP